MSIGSFTASPSTTLAGGHPNFSTAIRLSYSNTTDDIRTVETQLPPGLIGNPRAVASCTMAQLTADTCPAGSKIGTTSTIAKPDLPLVPALTSTGDVYNVAPVGSEPARIGLVVRPVPGPISLGKFSLAGVASVRVPGDFGLNVRFDNLPRTLQLVGGVAVGVQVQGLDLTLNGIVGGRSYMTNPTSCLPAPTILNSNSYEVGTTVSKTSTFTPTDCANVPFNPTPGFKFYESNYRADYPSTVAAGVVFPSNDLPRAQAHTKDAITVLPQGAGINAARLLSITPCTEAQLNQASAAPPTCPANSLVGQALVITPILGNVLGDVYFGAGNAQHPLRLFMTLKITSTQTAKFILNNSITPTGAIRADLNNLPQTPQTLFALGFYGGANGLIKTPATCGVHYGAGIFTPWSGNPATGGYASITQTKTTTGAPCPAAAAAKVTAPKVSGLSAPPTE